MSFGTKKFVVHTKNLLGLGTTEEIVEAVHECHAMWIVRAKNPFVEIDYVTEARASIEKQTKEDE